MTHFFTQHLELRPGDRCSVAYDVMAPDMLDIRVVASLASDDGEWSFGGLAHLFVAGRSPSRMAIDIQPLSPHMPADAWDGHSRGLPTPPS